jgi:hypothetical protein
MTVVGPGTVIAAPERRGNVASDPVNKILSHHAWRIACVLFCKKIIAQFR